MRARPAGRAGGAGRHVEQRRVRLVVVAAGERASVSGCAGARAWSSTRVGQRDDLLEHRLHRERGRTSTRIRASPSPALAKPCATPGGASTTSPGRRRRSAGRAGSARAGDDLEALGLDRVHVRDRTLPPGASAKSNASSSPPSTPRWVNVKRSPSRGWRAVARADHDHPRGGARRTRRSRAARGRARRTPSCGWALRRRAPRGTGTRRAGPRPARPLEHPRVEASPARTKRTRAGRGGDLRRDLLERQRARPVSS